MKRANIGNPKQHKIDNFDNTGIRSWNVLLREPSGDRIASSCRHTVPGLTVKTEPIIAICFPKNPLDLFQENHHQESEK